MPVGVDYKYALYTRDDGTTTVNVRIDKALADNEDAGFGTYDSTKPVINVRGKHSFTCRYALLISATTGNRRRVVIGSPSCDLWTGAQNTISFPVRGSATPEVFTVTHRVGESAAVAHDIFNL